MRRILILISGIVTALIGVTTYNPPQLAGAKLIPIDEPNSEPQVLSQVPTSSQQGAATDRTMTPTAKSQKSVKGSNSEMQTRDITPPPSSRTTSTETDVTAAPATYLGDLVSTKYGPVQVQITVRNGEIIDVGALSYPTRDRRSLQISQAVIPWLSQETLRIQTASVMAVSGATFTTNAWNQSLASALKKAGR